jgi:hypothetical protein
VTGHCLPGDKRAAFNDYKYPSRLIKYRPPVSGAIRGMSGHGLPSLVVFATTAVPMPVAFVTAVPLLI